MKEILKLIILLVCMALAVSVFAACKGGDGTTAVTTPNETPDSDAADSTTEASDGTTATVTTALTPIEPCASHTPSEGGTYCTVCHTVLISDEKDYLDMIYFSCDNETLTEAYKVALADCDLAVTSYQSGILTTPVNCIMAGADYDSPWTRDASINVWNAFAFLDPDAAKNTLYAVLKKSGQQYQIDGQYWDAIIWCIGAYQYYLATHDLEFLEIAQNAMTNSFKRFEREEFDATDNLFRGAAVYGDGIAAYPDRYATNIGTPGIESWVSAYPNEKVNVGAGLPMKALSTNCTYYQGYIILAKVNEILGKDATSELNKAEKLKAAINEHFWNEEKGTYNYLAYECDYQEAIGISFALMFGIADERQTALVLQNTVVTENGIACVWPSFDRYLALGGYGRHSGTIWPHAQGFWARACSMFGYTYGYENELFLMAEKAVRDGQFREIYHPDTGEVYGGLQGSGNNDIFLWGSCSHQTWSATAYLSLIYYEMMGAELDKDSVTFTPYLPTGVNEATVSGFKVGNTTFDIVVVRGGDYPTTATFSTTEEGTVTVCLSVK